MQGKKYYQPKSFNHFELSTRIPETIFTEA